MPGRAVLRNPARNKNPASERSCLRRAAAGRARTERAAGQLMRGLPDRRSWLREETAKQRQGRGHDQPERGEPSHTAGRAPRESATSVSGLSALYRRLSASRASSRMLKESCKEISAHVHAHPPKSHGHGASQTKPGMPPRSDVPKRFVTGGCLGFCPTVSRAWPPRQENLRTYGLSIATRPAPDESRESAPRPPAKRRSPANPHPATTTQPWRQEDGLQQPQSLIDLVPADIIRARVSARHDQASRTSLMRRSWCRLPG